MQDVTYQAALGKFRSHLVLTLEGLGSMTYIREGIDRGEPISDDTMAAVVQAYAQRNTLVRASALSGMVFAAALAWSVFICTT
jgi:hypothetical protein